MSTQWNGQADSGLDVHRFLVVAEFPPHFTLAIQEVPNLFHGSMRDRHRCLSSWKLEVSETSSSQRKK